MGRAAESNRLSHRGLRDNAPEFLHRLLRLLGQQRRSANTEVIGDAIQRADGDILAAGLNRRQVRTLHANGFRHSGLSLCTLLTRSAYVRPERA